MSTFGQFTKQLRIGLGLSLRQFCRQHDLDVGTQSKIERDLKAPPASREWREDVARSLGLNPESDDWRSFFDLADIAAGRIPEDVLEDENLAEKLPLVFRSMRGEKLTREQLREVAELLGRS